MAVLSPLKPTPPALQCYCCSTLHLVFSQQTPLIWCDGTLAEGAFSGLRCSKHSNTITQLIELSFFFLFEKSIYIIFFISKHRGSPKSVLSAAAEPAAQKAQEREFTGSAERCGRTCLFTAKCTFLDTNGNNDVASIVRRGAHLCLSRICFHFWKKTCIYLYIGMLRLASERLKDQRRHFSLSMCAYMCLYKYLHLKECMYLYIIGRQSDVFFSSVWLRTKEGGWWWWGGQQEKMFIQVETFKIFKGVLFCSKVTLMSCRAPFYQFYFCCPQTWFTAYGHILGGLSVTHYGKKL